MTGIGNRDIDIQAMTIGAVDYLVKSEINTEKLERCIRYALERAGASFKNVVRITAYVKDLADYPAYAKVRSEIFGADWPASASVGVSDLLFGARLEVDAVAFIAAG